MHHQLSKSKYNIKHNKEVTARTGPVFLLAVEAKQRQCSYTDITNTTTPHPPPPPPPPPLLLIFYSPPAKQLSMSDTIHYQKKLKCDRNSCLVALSILTKGVWVGLCFWHNRGLLWPPCTLTCIDSQSWPSSISDKRRCGNAATLCLLIAWNYSLSGLVQVHFLQ